MSLPARREEPAHIVRCLQRCDSRAHRIIEHDSTRVIPHTKQHELSSLFFESLRDITPGDSACTGSICRSHMQNNFSCHCAGCAEGTAVPSRNSSLPWCLRVFTRAGFLAFDATPHRSGNVARRTGHLRTLPKCNISRACCKNASSEALNWQHLLIFGIM